jgi:hypothetical protein
MVDGALLMKTAAEVAISTAENAIDYILMDTPVIPIISNGESKCVYTQKHEKRKQRQKK